MLNALLMYLLHRTSTVIEVLGKDSSYQTVTTLDGTGSTSAELNIFTSKTIFTDGFSAKNDLEPIMRCLKIADLVFGDVSFGVALLVLLVFDVVTLVAIQPLLRRRFA